MGRRMFLCALHEHDISILGEGTIYGQGDQVFYDDGADGGIGECPKNVRIEDRPRTTYFEDVENLTVRGITFRMLHSGRFIWRDVDMCWWTESGF